MPFSGSAKSIFARESTAHHFRSQPELPNRVISPCFPGFTVVSDFGCASLKYGREIGRKVRVLVSSLFFPTPPFSGRQTALVRTTVANVIPESAKRFSRCVCIIPAGLYTCLRPARTNCRELPIGWQRTEDEIFSMGSYFLNVLCIFEIT